MRSTNVRVRVWVQGTQTRGFGRCGGVAEAIGVRRTGFAAPCKGDGTQPFSVGTLTVVAADDGRVPISPTGKRREGNGKIGHVREEGGRDLIWEVFGSVCRYAIRSGRR